MRVLISFLLTILTFVLGAGGSLWLAEHGSLEFILSSILGVILFGLWWGLIHLWVFNR